MLLSLLHRQRRAIADAIFTTYQRFVLLALFCLLSVSLVPGLTAQGDLKGTFVLGRNTDSITLDPAMVDNNIDIWLLNNLYDQLVRLNPADNTFEPGLAASWTASYRLRGSGMSMIFQDPTTALNPVLTVEQQIVETLGDEIPKNRRRERAIDLLRKVGVPSPEERLRDYPHQFSGGTRQRVMIAIAIARNPRLLIADEPTTALDVTIQDQILKLLAQLQRESGMGLILVTHDLGVAQVCDRVGVMYAGEMVEIATTAELFCQPRHPYTIGLLSSVPRAEAAESKLRPIPGSLPDPRQLPTGCRFHPRCPWASVECTHGVIPLIEIGGGGEHFTRCIKSDQLVGVSDFPADNRGIV
ncbi:MAG: oligopeptide/dipeptide ABC transporter ATP-binding protein [Chloroflexota bacterium]